MRASQNKLFAGANISPKIIKLPIEEGSQLLVKITGYC